MACRVARAQGFTEGNERTALLMARRLLDRNGVAGALVLPPHDREFADILVQAASGLDVENDAVVCPWAGESQGRKVTRDPLVIAR